jgi:hypothetical protein
MSEQIQLPLRGQTTEGCGVACASCCGEVFIKQAGGGARHCSSFVFRLPW